jgi:hypothetical protein
MIHTEATKMSGHKLNATNSNIVFAMALPRVSLRMQSAHFHFNLERYAALCRAAFSPCGGNHNCIAPDFAARSRKIAIVGAMKLYYPAGVAAINQDANQVSEFNLTSPKYAKLRVIPHLAHHSKCASISEPAPLN